MATIVVALGGNALQRQGEASSQAQQRVAAATVKQLVPLVKEGHRLAIVHGNGPQVGNIILHEEAINTDDVPSLPLDDGVAMSQGLIGFWLQQSFMNAFSAQGMAQQAATIVTRTLVDEADAAFANPTKPIGPFYTADEAQRVAAERGFTVKEDAGRGWRRVVPSPLPQRILEADVIKGLVDAGVVTISTGGGGVPVIERDGAIVGVEAVIDKDFAAAELARVLHADTLLILTAVDSIEINYNTPQAKSLTQVTPEELLGYADAGHFAPGSMLPKVQAAAAFAQHNPGKQAIVTSLDKAEAALAGQAGTRIMAS